MYARQLQLIAGNGGRLREMGAVCGVCAKSKESEKPAERFAQVLLIGNQPQD